MHTSTAPKTIKLFAIAGLGEVYQVFAKGHSRIKFHCSFWRVQLNQTGNQPTNGQLVEDQSYSHRLTTGKLVLVMGRFGLTLLVQPSRSIWINLC